MPEQFYNKVVTPQVNKKEIILSLVFSFRNEGDVLSELIKRVTNTLKPLNITYELIFVNDASTDNSLSILIERSKEEKAIKIINMSRRFGISASLVAGIELAKGNAVVYLDADLQDPPELIPKLIQKWQEGADIVYTTRISREGESAIKIFITKYAYKLLTFTSDIDLPLNSGDFKLLNRRAVNELLKLPEKDPYLRGLVTWIGFKQAQVFYKREKRFAGKTHFPLWGTGPVKTFISGLTSFSAMPLYISLLIGLIVSFGAIVGLVCVIILKFLGKTLPGWAAMMVPLLFLSGIQLFTIGIMGLYIGRIYNEAKNRPNYIIESLIGFEE